MRIGKRYEADVPVWVWTLSGLASLGIVIGIVAIVVRKDAMVACDSLKR